MPIIKAVVPVAGLGTRLLPTTKAIPKVMLPLGRYPAIQHVVEEMVAAGLRKFLFVTSQANSLIKEQFDNNDREIEFSYIEQPIPEGSTKPEGTGAAIACAERFVNGDHFVVAYGDTIIHSTRKPNYVRRMIEEHLRHGVSCTLGVRSVGPDRVSQYGVVKPNAAADTSSESFQIDDVVEKPSPENAPSDLAINGRYVFGPGVFDEIRTLSPGPRNEIEVTDAIRGLIQSRGGVRSVQMDSGEIRYDIGNHETYFKAFIDFALQDADYGQAVRSYLAERSEEA